MSTKVDVRVPSVVDVRPQWISALPNSTCIKLPRQLTPYSNGLSRCCGTEPFPVLEEHTSDATSMGGNGNTLSAHAQTSQPQPLVTPQATSTWAMDNIVQTSNPSHRHTMMFIDSRPAKPEIHVSRPLSMTAVPVPRHLGFQNPRGEYLPQPHMPPPVVVQPKMTQAIIGHSELSSLFRTIRDRFR